jgi:uncharacterized protein YndB with AHSA1/START domain
MSKTLTVAMKGEREVVITRAFAAPRALVFDAHTKPELVRKWLTGPPGWTMPVCKIDLRVGGKYRYEWRKDNETLALGGTFREIAVPERLVSAEIFDEDWTGGETVNTMVFTEAGNKKTTLTFTILYASAAAREAALKTGMTTGMEMSYASLDAMLAG